MVASYKPMRGNAIANNDSPSVGGSKDTIMKIINKATLLFSFKNEVVIKLSLIPAPRIRGNWNTIPRRDEVMNI